MKTTIAIPSCSSGRIPLLFKTIESIMAGDYKDFRIVIVADGNPHIYNEVKKWIITFTSTVWRTRDVTIIQNKKRKDWIFSTNRVFREFDSDYYIYASDDLIFPPDCIKNAVATMRKRFPDGFGLVTLAKRNRCPFGLVGRKFVEHFPDRRVFCPDYIHYRSDMELMRTVKELGVFAYSAERESRVKHSRMKDETWRLARKSRERDFKVYHKREDKGYKWGIDFNLITRKGKILEA